MKLADFLNQYNMVIFDMDGVITHEQVYWTASALSVYEYLYSKDYFGDKTLSAEDMMEKAKDIRALVFSNDKTIGVLKDKGVNSNWDLGYIVLALAIENKGDFDKVLEDAKNLDDNALFIYPKIKDILEKNNITKDCERNGELWQDLRDCFQEWFLGDKLYREVFNKTPVLKGKMGMSSEETPIIDKCDLVEIFKLLNENNIKIGIATGRPKSEAISPLESFGILPYIDENSIIYYDYVYKAEEKTGIDLPKPHPYTFQKAFLGKDYPDEKIVRGEFSKEGIEKVLAVGDAGADMLSAHNAGMDFCAVLTGVKGEGAREYFKKENARYILNSLRDFLAE